MEAVTQDTLVSVQMLDNSNSIRFTLIYGQCIIWPNTYQLECTMIHVVCAPGTMRDIYHHAEVNCTAYTCCNSMVHTECWGDTKDTYVRIQVRIILTSFVDGSQSVQLVTAV